MATPSYSPIFSLLDYIIDCDVMYHIDNMSNILFVIVSITFLFSYLVVKLRRVNAESFIPFAWLFMVILLFILAISEGPYFFSFLGFNVTGLNDNHPIISISDTINISVNSVLIAVFAYLAYKIPNQK